MGLTRNEQYTTDRGIYGSIGRQIQHYSLVTGCSRDYMGILIAGECLPSSHSFSPLCWQDIRLHLPNQDY